MRTCSPTVFGALSASPNARVLHSMDLGFGRAAAIWSNNQDRIAYERPEGHTFSLYLQGGEGTRRLGQKGGRGSPGAVCVMPQAHSSNWEITSGFVFVHLYLPDAELRASFAEIFDRDARVMVLPELTFGDAPRLAGALRWLAAALTAGDALSAEAAMAQAVVEALSSRPAHRPPQVKGGLTPHLRRRIAEYVEARLDQPLRLADLAALVDMSIFHFQRVFSASHGISPQSWITRRRLDQARMLLRSNTPIAQIAVACGFSNQSHMTRLFRSATGTTPAAYRIAASGKVQR